MKELVSLLVVLLHFFVLGFKLIVSSIKLHEPYWCMHTCFDINWQFR